MTATRIRLGCPGSCRPRWVARAGGLFLAAAQLVLFVGVATSTADEQPLRIRRIFVPADDPESWTNKREKFLPVPAEQVDELIARTNSASLPTVPAVQIVQAVYRARWEDDQLVDGQAELDVVCTGSDTAFLLLGDLSIAILRPRWQAEDAPPVQLGSWGKAGEATARFGLMVPRSDRLSFEWRPQTVSMAADAVVIPLRLPPGKSRRLVLDLPFDMRPVVPGGVGTPRPSQAAENEARRQWEIVLPGDAELPLRLDKPAEEPRESPTYGSAGYRVAYEIDHRGLTFQTVLAVTTDDDFTGRLTFNLDPRIQLFSLTEDGEELTWHVETDGGEDGTRAVVTLPEAITPHQRTIVAEAWAPLVLDQSWRLPQLQAAELSWQSGERTLTLPAEFELLDIVTPKGSDLVQTGVSLPADVAEGSTFEFTQLSAAPALEIVVGRRGPHLVAGLATDIDLASGEYHGRLVADLKIEVGQQHEISAALAPGWHVMDVTTDPPSALAEWNIDEREPGPILQVRLAEPLRPQKTLRLTVDSRFTPPAESDQPLAVDALRMFQATDFAVQRHIMQLAADANWQIQLERGGRPLAVEDLTDADQSRLTAAPEAVLLDVTDPKHGGTVRLSSTTDAVRLDVEIVVTTSAGRLDTTYRFGPTQTGNPRGPLRFAFDAPLVGDVRWTDAATGTSLAAQPARNSDPQVAAGADEIWELQLGESVSPTPVVEARVSTPWTAAARIPLPRLIGGAASGGHVVIRSAGGSDPAVDQRGLEQVLAGDDPGSNGTRVVAAYRYPPAPGRSRRLLLAPQRDSAGLQRRYVSWAELTTACAAGGPAVHRVDLYVTDYDGSEFAFRLPDGARLESVHVNDRSQLTSPVAGWNGDSQREVRVNLPVPGGVASVRFTTSTSAVAGFGRLRAPLPQLDMPILAGRWTVWMPPPVAAFGPGISVADRAAGWRARLFGRWARPADRRPLNPLLASAWTDGWLTDSQQTEIRREARKFLDQLSKWMSMSEPAASPSWAELLSGVANELDDPGDLWVDFQSLGEVGITASTLVLPNGPDATSARAEVALLLDGPRLIVTSHRAAAIAGTWVAEFANEPVFERTHRSVDDGKGESAPYKTPGALGLLVPVVDWSEIDFHGRSVAASSADDLDLPPNWGAVEIPFGGDRPAAITLVRTQSLDGFSWAACLMCMPIAVVLASRSRVGLVGAVAVAALLCLLLSPPAAAIARASLGGFVAGVAYWCLTCRLTPDGASPLHRRAASIMLGAVAAGALVMNAAAPVAAQQSNSSREELGTPTPQSNDVYPILIPMDADRQPVGSQYFVSERLLRELNRRASRTTQAAASWLIRDAAYAGELNRATDDGAVAAGNWTAELDLEVLVRDTRLVLPWRRSQAEWAATASLDGLPVELEWPDAEAGCSLLVREPGRYQLVATFVPRVVRDEAHGRIALEIPRVPNSRLSLSLPPELEPLEILGGDGEPVRGALAGARWVADLGSADRFGVRWPAGSTAEADATSVDELLWIHISNANAILHAKFARSREGDEPLTLPLELDPRLRPIVPVEAEETDETQLVDEAARDQAPTAVELASAQSLPEREPLSFTVHDVPRLGRFQLPTFRFDKARTRGRRLAITCDAALDCNVVSELGASSVPVEDFLAGWGPVEESPQRAFQLTGDAPGWQLVLRPADRDSTVDATLSLVVGRREVGLTYEADVLPGRDEQFGHRLRVPTDVAIDDIRVTSGGEPVTIRWTRHDRNQVVVFFSRQLADGYRLVVEGRRSVPVSGRLPVPVIGTTVEPLQRQRLLLYRREDAIVQFDAGGAGEPIEPPPAVRARPGTRLVGAYALTENTSSDAPITVTPNLPAAVGRSVTRVYRENGNWMAAWSCQFRVERGQMDTLQLDLPDVWTGPLAADPNLRVAVTPVERPGPALDRSAAARAVVRLADSIEPGGEIRLVLRGPLKSSREGGLEIPRIVFRNAQHTERYIVVPAEIDGQPAVWSRVGVAWAENPPPDLLPVQLLTGATQLFRVENDPFLMRLQAGSVAGAEASVSLIDVHAIRDPAGGQLVCTDFVLQPRGVTECRLEVPSDQQLVDVFLGGHPCVLEKEGDRRWRIPIASPDLPHVLRVTTRRRAAGRIRPGQELIRPRLVAHGREIFAQLTLWTLTTPQDSVQLVGDNAAPIPPIDHTLLRLAPLLRAAESGAPQALVAPSPDGQLWAGSWYDSMTAARQQAAAAITRFADTAAVGQIPTQLPPDQQLRQWTEQFQSWAAQFPFLEVGDIARQADESGSRQAQYASPWLATEGPLEHSYFISEGGPQHILVTPPSPMAKIETSPLVAAVAVVLLALATAWGLRRAELRDLVWRWPQAIGVAVGLAWWAWLSPSGLGLVIVAVSLLARLRTHWSPTPAVGSSSSLARRSQQAMVAGT